MKLSKEQRAYRSKPAPAIYTGPNRGHNTPRDVLAYIERQWERHQPEDVDTLAAELGYDTVALHKLKQRHGTGLRRHLQGIRRSRRDTDRFLAKQQGRSHPEQYSNNHQDAIDDAPVIPPHAERQIEKERLTNAELLYQDMRNTEAALSARLAMLEGTEYAGEIRRARNQVRRAADKAERKLSTYELDHAA